MSLRLDPSRNMQNAMTGRIRAIIAGLSGRGGNYNCNGPVP